jgi:S-adenosyl methyltransferase
MEPGLPSPDIDTSRPHPARMYDYYLGGTDNYPADREAAEAVLSVAPVVREAARENRAFLQRAVRFLVGEAGVGQFIDIGAGIPSGGNVHEIARQVAPDVRVVYVDNDPIVQVHAGARLAGDANTRVILADLRDPAAILAQPQVRELIDFSQPVALLLLGVLYFITDDEGPGQLIGAYRDSLPQGSYLALSHGCADEVPEDVIAGTAAAYDQATAPLVLRNRAQISRFFDGFEPVDPGLVYLPLWRPDGSPPDLQEASRTGMFGGVGRKGGGGPP